MHRIKHPETLSQPTREVLEAIFKAITNNDKTEVSTQLVKLRTYHPHLGSEENDIPNALIASAIDYKAIDVIAFFIEEGLFDFNHYQQYVQDYKKQNEIIFDIVLGMSFGFENATRATHDTVAPMTEIIDRLWDTHYLTSQFSLQLFMLLITLMANDAEQTSTFLQIEALDCLTTMFNDSRICMKHEDQVTFMNFYVNKIHDKLTKLTLDELNNRHTRDQLPNVILNEIGTLKERLFEMLCSERLKMFQLCHKLNQFYDLICHDDRISTKIKDRLALKKQHEMIGKTCHELLGEVDYLLSHFVNMVIKHIYLREANTRFGFLTQPECEFTNNLCSYYFKLPKTTPATDIITYIFDELVKAYNKFDIKDVLSLFSNSGIGDINGTLQSPHIIHWTYQLTEQYRYFVECTREQKKEDKQENNMKFSQ